MPIPPGIGQRVGEIAREVGDHQGRHRRQPGRAQPTWSTAPRCRTADSPARPASASWGRSKACRAAGNAATDVLQPRAAAESRRVTRRHDPRQPEDENHGANRDRDGSPVRSTSCGPPPIPSSRSRPPPPSRVNVDRAGEEEQAARALEDLPGGHAGEVKQPPADRQGADAAAGQKRPRPHLGPGHLTRQRGRHGCEEEAEDDDEAHARATSRATAAPSSPGLIPGDLPHHRTRPDRQPPRPRRRWRGPRR